MDVELGLELAKCLDEFVSGSPIFISGETDNMFILTAVLKGYTRELIKIDVNECERSLVISGEKPVQDMVMVGWKVYKKEIKMMGFTKAFMIPDGVIIEQIEARFNKENFKLSVAMPKMVKGLKGIKVKEVKVEEHDLGGYRSLQVLDDDGNVRKIDLASGEMASVSEPDREVDSMKEKIENEVEQEEKKLEETIVTTVETFAEQIADCRDYLISPDVLPQLKGEKTGKALEETCETNSFQEDETQKCDINEKERVGYDGEGSVSNNTQEQVSTEKPSTTTEKKFRDQSTQTDPPRKPKKCCVPMIAGGSALLISVLVFAIHLIRDQDKPRKKK